MNSIFRYFLFFIVSFSIIGCQSDTESQVDLIKSEFKSEVDLLPIPIYVDLHDGQFAISNQIEWKGPSNPDNIIDQAIKSFENRLQMLNMVYSSKNTWIIDLSVTEPPKNLYPDVDVDESYSIEVTNSKVRIEAPSSIGIERALQSLTQLVEAKSTGAYIPYCTIYDRPQYPWRGLMIDVVRHWIPKEVILQNIDAMALVKLNVLHLHLSDDQGFRVESKAYPLLHQESSEGLYYTQEDIKDIITYAAKRGVRVVPEFTLPGHATSILKAYPSLGNKKENYELQKGYGIFQENLDPTNQEVYTFLAGFFKEMADLFPDEYVHIGGNEVLPVQWQQDESIQKFIQDKGLKNEFGLQLYFNMRLIEILRNLDKKMMGWDEISHPEMAKNQVLIQSWRGQESLFDALRMGAPAILSAGWFLDHKLHASDLYSIDPSLNSEALNIEPDTANWCAYEVTTTVNNIDQNGMLILFGKEDNLRGVLNIMNRNSVFKEAQLKGDILRFQIDNNAERINAQIKIGQNEINGILRMSIADIPIKGIKVGGNDMIDGMVLPKFSKPSPVNASQFKNMLGGEACIWTEWVTPQNINNRIWPSASAVAEKLWSHPELTNDIPDFYRRLSVFQSDLKSYGILSDHFKQAFLASKCPQDTYKPMMILLDCLEEVKNYERWKYEIDHNIKTPLNNVADIVDTESMSAYDFDQDVNAFTIHSRMEEKVKIQEKLALWIPLYRLLKPTLSGDETLKDIQFHCLALSDLSKIANQYLDGQSLSSAELSYYLELKEQINYPRVGVLLANANTLIKLIDHLRKDNES
jgi:hexosaminidase